MKVALIIYVIYESVFFRNSHSALDVEVFESIQQCEMVKLEAVRIIKDSANNIDKIVAQCKKIQ